MVALLGSAPRPVLPPVMWAAFRLLAKGPITRQEIADLLLPSSLRTAEGRTDSVTVAMEALMDLGVIVEQDGHLRVDGKPGTREDDEGWFRRELRRRVLAAGRNKDLFRSDEGTRELTKALAWFLAQPVDDPPVSYNPKAKSETNSVTQLLNEQFGSDEGAKSILPNSYRWSPFVRWAKYLGFISFLPIKDGGPCPNPVEAIRDELPELDDVMDGEVELPSLVSTLAKAIPVLDGGSYRRLVEEHMDKPPPSSGNSETLSASLSFALLRLKDEGVIDLQRESDSPATRTLTVRRGHRLLFSHAKVLISKPSAA